MHKPCFALFVIVLLVSPALAAPELSESDRQRLADGTTDHDGLLDQQDGLYVLLRNASTWQGDDFGGDAGAALAPPPDYDFLQANPTQARGNVYLIEGWLNGTDRWPTQNNHNSDTLYRRDSAWGSQLTRWTLQTEKGNPKATVIVLLHDPNAKLATPERGDKVRVAARFHKLWTIPDATGKPFTYAVFVGGAAKTIEQAKNATASDGSVSSLSKILGAIVVVGGFFVAMRFLMKKVSASGGGGRMLQDRLDAMRREREADGRHAGHDEEEKADDLPDDPVAALDVLRQKHQAD